MDIQAEALQQPGMLHRGLEIAQRFGRSNIARVAMVAVAFGGAEAGLANTAEAAPSQEVHDGQVTYWFGCIAGKNNVQLSISGPYDPNGYVGPENGGKNMTFYWADQSARGAATAQYAPSRDIDTGAPTLPSDYPAAIVYDDNFVNSHVKLNFGSDCSKQSTESTSATTQPRPNPSTTMQTHETSPTTLRDVSRAVPPGTNPPTSAESTTGSNTSVSETTIAVATTTKTTLPAKHKEAKGPDLLDKKPSNDGKFLPPEIIGGGLGILALGLLARRRYKKA